MQFYYQDHMPLRILDEGEFWKHQEAEHTQVIRALTSNLEPQYVEALASWEQAFSRTQAMFVKYIEMLVRSGNQASPEMNKQIMQLVWFALEQSQKFVELLNQLGTESAALKSNPTAITVLNHIRRESEYFMGIATAYLNQQQ